MQSNPLSKKQDLSPSQKNRLAWKMVVADITLYAIFALIIVCAILVVLGFYYALFHFLNNQDNWEVYIGGIALIVLLLQVILLLYSKKQKYLLEIEGKKHSTWKKNNGSEPSYKVVNIQRADGSIAWRVKADDLDWSVDAENPIIEYMGARA